MAKKEAQKEGVLDKTPVDQSENIKIIASELISMKEKQKEQENSLNQIASAIVQQPQQTQQSNGMLNQFLAQYGPELLQTLKQILLSPQPTPDQQMEGLYRELGKKVFYNMQDKLISNLLPTRKETRQDFKDNSSGIQ